MDDDYNLDDNESDNEPEDTSSELLRLARETFEAQGQDSDPPATRARCQRVIDLYAQGAFLDAEDYFHAGWVLLNGETQAHYNLSRSFAHRAATLGDTRAWTLEAMAWDRLLISSGQQQRFGTQIIKQGGRWSLGAVDPTITDLDRAMYGVPPLYVQQQQAERLQRQEERDL